MERQTLTWRHNIVLALIAGYSVLVFPSSARHEERNALLAERPKLILKGTLNCVTKGVQVTEGVLGEKQFGNLQELSAALNEKDYKGKILSQIDELRLCDSPARPKRMVMQTDNRSSFAAGVNLSLLLEIDPLKNKLVTFSLAQIDFAFYNSIGAYLKAVEHQQGCKSISANCVKCPDKKIYCTD